VPLIDEKKKLLSRFNAQGPRRKIVDVINAGADTVFSDHRHREESDGGDDLNPAIIPKCLE
jgi:hypothetical protein